LGGTNVAQVKKPVVQQNVFDEDDNDLLRDDDTLFNASNNGVSPLHFDNLPKSRSNTN